MNNRVTNKEICELYFQGKMTFSDISKQVNISISQVSRIVRKDENYISEKNRRKEENRKKHKEYTKQLMKKKKGICAKKNKNEKAILDYLHNQASVEMSNRRGINNQSFRDWNSSIYRFHYKTKEYRIKEELKNKISYAAPKKLNGIRTSLSMQQTCFLETSNFLKSYKYIVNKWRESMKDDFKINIFFNEDGEDVEKILSRFLSNLLNEKISNT